MIYLRIEHTEDDDQDLIKFNSIADVIHYLKENPDTEGFFLTDNQLVSIGGYRKDDYTLYQPEE